MHRPTSLWLLPVVGLLAACPDPAPIAPAEDAATPVDRAVADDAPAADVASEPDAPVDATNPPDATADRPAPADAPPDVTPRDAPVVMDVPVTNDRPVAMDAPVAMDRPAVTDAPDAAADRPVSVDAAPDAAPDLPAPMNASAARCGTARPDLSATRGSEGIVIGPDGTIYYSQPSAVGRIRPGAAPESRWVAIAGSTVWGLALDTVRNRLYVGSPTTRALYVVDLAAATPTSQVFVASAGSPNGLTLGPDGALWYTDFSGGHVYRVDAAGVRTQVTMTAIGSANGLRFGADGGLYVLSYATGIVHRLTVVAGRETERSTFGRVSGSPDGLMFDARGRLYITGNGSGELLRLEADGTGPTSLRTGLSSAANLEFGTGALRCDDLYIATGAGVVRYEMADAPGPDLPWHR